MEKFNTDLTQVIKWQQNEAPNIQSLVLQKSDWYKQYNDQFWSDWYTDIFNIDTCNVFGIYIWCEILGIPREKVVLTPITKKWAYGDKRENYKYSGIDTTIPVGDRNIVGGNFVGMSDDVITDIDEARTVLKLRYMTLTSDGRMANINRMLRWIYNGGEPWNYGTGYYVYLSDMTQSSDTVVNSGDFIINDWQGESRIPLGYTQRQYVCGQAQPLAAGGGLNRASSRSESPLYFQWTGYPAANPATPRAEGVGGDTQLQTGPDTLGQMGGPYPSSTLDINLRSAVRLIKTQNPPPTSETGLPTQDLVYCCRVDGTFGIAGNTSLPTEVGAKVVLSVFVRATSDNVKSIQIREYAATFSNPTKFVDPICGYFNIDGSMNYSIRGLNDDLPRDPTLGGIEAFYDNWYRIWIVLEVAESTANVQPNLGVIPWESDAFQKNKVTLRMGESFMVYGYSINDCVEGYNDNSPPYYYPGGTVYKNVDAKLFDMSITGPQVTFDCLTGNFGLYPSSSGRPISYSLLQPGATVAFEGFFNRYPFAADNLLVGTATAVANGSRTSFLSNVPPGMPQPYTQQLSMRYNFGKNVVMSAQMLNLISNRANGILPANAGIGYSVYVYTPDLSPIDLTTPNLDYRITIPEAQQNFFTVASNGKIMRVPAGTWPLVYNFAGVLQGRWCQGQSRGFITSALRNTPMDSTNFPDTSSAGNSAVITPISTVTDEMPAAHFKFTVTATGVGLTSASVGTVAIPNTTAARIIMVIDSAQTFSLDIYQQQSNGTLLSFGVLNITPGKKAYVLHYQNQQITTSPAPRALQFGIRNPSVTGVYDMDVYAIYATAGSNPNVQPNGAVAPFEMSAAFPNGSGGVTVNVTNPDLAASGIRVTLKDGKQVVQNFPSPTSVSMNISLPAPTGSPSVGPDFFTQCATLIEYIPKT